MRELNITTREEGQRLDKILSKYLNKAPKSFVYNIFFKQKTAYEITYGDWSSDVCFSKQKTEYEIQV